MAKPSETRIQLELEKSRILREKAKLVLNKSVALYVLFTLVAVLGFFFEVLDAFTLNIMIVLGIGILILGTVPYLFVVSKEEKKINDWLKKIK